MTESFIYIIRSDNKSNADDNTNSCSIQLGGLPSHYREFDVEFIGLNLEIDDCIFTQGSFIEIRTDNIGLMNGYDTTHKHLQTIGIVNSVGVQLPLTFRCNNFNNRYVNFSLYGSDSTLLQGNYNAEGVADFNRPWVLVLKMTGRN
jgi:hypothetical protein